MSNRTLIVAVAMAVLAAVGAWLTTPGSRPAAALAEARETFTLGLDVPSIVRVEVSAGGEIAGAEFDDGDWVITLPGDGGPVRWPGDGEAVRAMLRQLATAPFELRDSRDGEPLATLEIATADGSAATVEAIGRALAGMVPVRVRTPSGERFGAAPAERLRPMAPADIASLAEARPFAVAGVVDRVELEQIAGASLTLVRRGGVWSIEGSRARVQQDAARELVERLADLRASSIVLPQDPASLGEPSVRVRAGVQTPRMPGEQARSGSAELVVGEQASLAGDVYALATRDFGGGRQHLLITLDGEAFPELSTDPAVYLDPVPLPWPASETGALTVSMGGQELEYRRTLEGWTAGDRPAPTLVIRELLARLGEPRSVALARPDAGETIATLTLAPIGAGEAVELAVARAPDGVRLTDRLAVWLVGDEGLVDLITRLASP